MDFKRLPRSLEVKVGDNLVLACENRDTGIMANVFILKYTPGFYMKLFYFYEIFMNQIKSFFI